MNENLLYAMVKQCHINSTAFYLNTTNEEVELLKRKMKRTLLGIVIGGPILFFILSSFFLDETSILIIVLSSTLILCLVFYTFHFKKALRFKKEGSVITNRDLLQANWVTLDKKYEALDKFHYVLIKSNLLVKSTKKSIGLLVEIESKLRGVEKRSRIKKEKFFIVISSICALFLGAIWTAVIEKNTEGTMVVNLLAFALVLILFCLVLYYYSRLIVFEEVDRCDLICNRLNDLKLKLMSNKKKKINLHKSNN
ncbi:MULTISPECIES: hypothetical protein [unclassified Myroides]|uniref:hypothetical protein n=1 Tax=unclassified Myroides TaxID=2642485 RepID=UPI003D2F6052